MTKKTTQPAGRIGSVGYLILTSLADGEKHGYALTQDVADFAGVRIAPGSLYEALARLESQGLIEPVASSDRKRPYRLTAAGAGVLDDYLSAQERLASVARRRLRASWRFASANTLRRVPRSPSAPGATCGGIPRSGGRAT